jgi:hypothetical protein
MLHAHTCLAVSGRRSRERARGTRRHRPRLRRKRQRMTPAHGLSSA